MTEIRVKEGIYYCLELMEEICAKILWYVSNDATNSVSAIQVMIVCYRIVRSTSDSSMVNRLTTNRSDDRTLDTRELTWVDSQCRHVWCRCPHV